jgi:hypothetical protein
MKDQEIGIGLNLSLRGLRNGTLTLHVTITAAINI